MQAENIILRDFEICDYSDRLLASPLVAHMLEGMMAVAATGPPRGSAHHPGSMPRCATRGTTISPAKLRVAVTEAMVERGRLGLDADVAAP